MLGFGLSAWNTVMLLSLGLAAVAAILVTVSTRAVIVLQDREARANSAAFTRFKIEANERTAALEAEAETAKATVAEANRRTAEALERAALADQKANEAKLELERFRAPRVLTDEQSRKIIKAMTKWAAIPRSEGRQAAAIFAVDTSFESASLADQIARVLGKNGAGFSINRNRVTYGKDYSVSGVAILTSRNGRGQAVAEELASVLNENGISTSIIPEKRTGCEEMGPEHKDSIDTDPACSSISVMVGEHPR